MIPLLMVFLAQNFEQRGFIENSTFIYPQTAPNDPAQVINDTLFRWEVSYKITPWFQINGAFDAETDTHQEVERTFRLDFTDRSIERPAFSARRYSATLHKGKFTAELGRQFIRWGKTDILNPLDPFAPKDYSLIVVNPDFLGVIAARGVIDTGNNSVELVWQPVFTPARTPLLDQRWTVIPEAAEGVAIQDLGARDPGRSQFGARWNHIASGYEYSFIYFDGFNYLPLFNAQFNPANNTLGVQRYYPELRLYGASAAVPLRWFTVKGEGAYFSSTTPDTDEFALYVIQIERQWKEWSFVGGYAGEARTHVGNPLEFQPAEGLARSFLGRAAWTIDPNRSLTIETAVRSGGSFTRFEYSQAYGQHWRATAGYAWIRGEMTDFIGQFHRNSYASLALRYSF
ncbi:MAG TPA: hypothetical protein VMB85_12965 [Bryobacteraceae bacterium]|nr:hypothetical protein [Bryobacteraceae bacterium]